MVKRQFCELKFAGSNPVSNLYLVILGLYFCMGREDCLFLRKYEMLGEIDERITGYKKSIK